MSGYTEITLLQYDLEKLRAELAEKDEVIAEAGEMLAMRDRQLAALKTENESLKLDAERYRWLKSQEPSKHDGYAIGYFDTCGVDAWRMIQKDLDQAIDAAMIAGEQG